MAEGEEEPPIGDESVTLFVGQVPEHMTEAELLPLFREIALVDELTIYRDKITLASQGCCFVSCPSRQEADKAVKAFHNKRTLPGASFPLQVRYADGDLERLENKLFIGGLTENVSVSEISLLFSQYGTITDLQIPKGFQLMSRGYAFLKYETRNQALAAIKALNRKHTMEGSTFPIVVEWARNRKEREARRVEKAQHEASNVHSADSTHPYLYGTLPMGYISPYYGFSYQAPGTYGLLQYRPPHVQNQSVSTYVVPPAYGGHALHGVTLYLAFGMAPQNHAMLPGSHMGSAYPAVPGLQNRMRYPSEMTSNGPLNGSQGSVSPPTVNSDTIASSSASENSGDQVQGPTGANLLISQLPREFGDLELANTFQPFGTVLSAQVFFNEATGPRNCFGIVSYDSPAAAQSAIQMMNGCELGGKKLKVELKKSQQAK